MDEVSTLLRRMGNASDEDIAVFKKYVEFVAFKKHDILLEEGQVENYLYIIKKGVLRSYKLVEKNDKVKEVTFNLIFPGWFYSSYDSFMRRKPCTFTTECISDVEVYRFSYDNIQKIYQETESGEKIGRIAAEHLYRLNTIRLLSLLTDSVDERYLKIVNSKPRMLQEVPLKYLAAYIGVTPQALSNIRSRVFKK